MDSQAHDGRSQRARARHQAATARRAADILIAGDTIAEIGPPGLAAPADADRDRCHRPADPSRD